MGEDAKTRSAPLGDRKPSGPLIFTISVACVLNLLGFGVVRAGPAPASKTLQLTSGSIEPIGLSEMDTDGTARVRIVQALGPARSVLDGLRDRGVRVLGYLHEDAYLVQIESPDDLSDLGGVRWQGAVRPEWKHAPSLARLDGSSLVGLKIAAYPGLGLVRLRREIEGSGKLVRLADDSTGTGHALIRVRPGGLALALEALSGLDEVAWISPEVPIISTNDDSMWVIQGGDFASESTPIFDHGIVGDGQIIAIADSGLDTDSCQFRFSAATDEQTFYNSTQPPGVQITNPDNKVLSYYLLNGATAYDDFSKLGHGTHVAGCAAGDDYSHLAGGASSGRDPQDGMAPAARLIVQDIGRRDGIQAGLPGSLVDMFVQAYESGARIHNNSYGQDLNDTSYGSESRDVDEAAWSMPEMLIVASAGNRGPSSQTLVGLGSTAKNAVVVGASLAGVSNQGRGVCHFSSQGPAADGRIRPDLVAPGAVRSALEPEWVQQGGTDIYGQPTADSSTDPPNSSCSVDAGYRIGTSFSAPLVAGAAALVRQYFVDGYFPAGAVLPAAGFVPSASLIKAVLVNAAESIDGPLYDVSSGQPIRDLAPAPTSVQGWGLLRLDRSLYFSGDSESLAVLNDCWGDGIDRGAASRAPLEEGQAHTFSLLAVQPGTPLRITLTWTDPAGSTGSGRTLVNDLDLEVEDASGSLFRGNVSLVDNRSQPAAAAPADDLNPLEQVILDPVGTGDVTVRVVGRQVPGNGRTDPYPSTRQGYALVAAGDFQGVCLDPPCGEQDGGLIDAGVDAGFDAGVDAGQDAGMDGGGDAAGADEATGGGDSSKIVGGCGCSGSGSGGGLGIAALLFAWWVTRRAGGRSHGC